MKPVLLAILIGLVLMGCSKKVKLQPATERDGYAYQEIETNVFVVTARDEESLTRALQELLCGFCEVKFTGVNFFVTRLRVRKVRK